MTKVTNDPRRACQTALPALARAGLGAAVLGFTLGLAGCSSSGSSGSASTGTSASGASAQRTGDLIDQRREAFKIDHDAYSSIGYRLDWRGFPVVQAREHITYLDVYDDVVIAQESGATVSALEASNGALRNSGQVANPLTRFVGNLRVGNHFIISSDNEIFAFDLDTGTLASRHGLNRVVTTHPVHFDGQIVYGSAIGHMYSRRLSPPIDAWAFDLGGPIDTDPVIVGSVVTAISRSGEIAMLDVPTGTLVGRARIFAGCDAAPVGGDGMVFFASLDQSIYAFDLEGGMRWRIRTELPLRVTPTYHNGTLYVPSDDMGLRAIDALTGTAIWAQDEANGRVVGMRNGRLMVWDGDAVVTLDPDTGDVIDSVELPGVSMVKPDRFEDGNLYVVSDGGIIAKFQAHD